MGRMSHQVTQIASNTHAGGMSHHTGLLPCRLGASVAHLKGKRGRKLKEKKERGKEERKRRDGQKRLYWVGQKVHLGLSVTSYGKI